jgi:DNA-binding beta-propeller fold protein YncE
VPANGDVNPYGIVRVDRSVGNLVRGNILVSNFNASSNLQGTGTTIMQITPTGAVSLFAQIDTSSLPGACPGGVGMTTALAVLNKGWVIVGSLPTSDGTSATAQAGCLIVLNSMGSVVETFSGAPINGPWDMTAVDMGNTAALFFTNVLNGTVGAGGNVRHDGTVVRMWLDLTGVMPKTVSTTVIGRGFPERTDPAALVIGPTGVGYDAAHDVLYVADSLSNRIAAITGALTRTMASQLGSTVSTGGSLNDPLGLTLAPNGDILTVNGNDGRIVETTPAGMQLATKFIDSSGNPPGAGALFGLIARAGIGVYFVDDASNTLNLLH